MDIVQPNSRYAWCEGQKDVIARSIQWTRKDLEAVKKILRQVKDRATLQILEKGSEQMAAAIHLYRQCSETLDKIMERERSSDGA
jgi:hypothetical protein